MAGLVNLEDEEEVKGYLENLGIEYSYQCYKEGDPDGCHRLADYLEGVKKDFHAAAKVLKENCEKNENSESCYKLGAYYATGKGEKQLLVLFLLPPVGRKGSVEHERWVNPWLGEASPPSPPLLCPLEPSPHWC
ncbi:putative acyl-CoA dehydrogenase [Platysternon megacephalum]|uniref:Cytochrome c oxidase assembly factor 7 n=1 Tax=Platysternon megacephalum TaxID=55544 RepID=A0A4D9DC71_9SAUR|nr:putative acyl-CoA dehydrogenase [Platysternon megacephalum]